MCLGIPGRVLEIVPNEKHPLFAEGRVDFGGVVKHVSLAYTPEARVGEYVIVHAGFALHVIDEHEARRTLRFIEEMGELAELEEAGP
jgi:hydrogenase expression/formation protein HypC